MNQETDRASAPTTHTITPHLVIRGAAQAADWYQQAFGAQVGPKIPMPGGKFIQIQVRMGDSTVMLVDEFPDMGVVSPLSVGGTSGALHIATQDADALWERAMAAGATVHQPLQEMFWGDTTDRSSTRSGTAGHLSAPPRRAARGGHPSRGSDVRRPGGLTIPVSRLSAVIPSATSRRTAALHLARSLSRNDVVPRRAEDCVVKLCEWHSMQGVRGSNPLSSTPTTPQVSVTARPSPHHPLSRRRSAGAAPGPRAP
jgi:PhnB protein